MSLLTGLGKPDNKGRHTRDLGWELAPDGKLRQHRFLLGKERQSAENRYTVVGKIWEAVEKRWSLDGRKTAKLLWDSVSRKIAMAAARGEDKVPFPSWELAHLIPDGMSYADDSKALYKVVTGLQRSVTDHPATMIAGQVVTADSSTAHLGILITDLFGETRC